MKYQKLDLLLLKTTGRTEMVKPALFNRTAQGFLRIHQLFLYLTTCGQKVTWIEPM
jgi:hypothetical protein